MQNAEEWAFEHQNAEQRANDMEMARRAMNMTAEKEVQIKIHLNVRKQLWLLIVTFNGVVRIS